LERYRLDAPDTRRHHLAAALRQRTGLVASSRSELEWVADELVGDVKSNELAKWHSEQNYQYFQAARTRFEQLDLHVHYAGTSDLAIGDSPVITTIHGRAGAGPHQNIGVQRADHVAMPITPTALITLGDSAPDTHLTDADVDRYNSLQWATYDTWIAARPGGDADRRLKSSAEGDR
jgi:hypothetical protein